MRGVSYILNKSALHILDIIYMDDEGLLFGYFFNARACEYQFIAYYYYMVGGGDGASVCVMQFFRLATPPLLPREND